VNSKSCSLISTLVVVNLTTSQSIQIFVSVSFCINDDSYCVEWKKTIY